VKCSRAMGNSTTTNSRTGTNSANTTCDLRRPSEFADEPSLCDQGVLLRKRRAEFGQLVTDLESTLMRTAHRMCGRNRDHAQDLVQDTFVRGYQAYLDGKFQPGTNARAWLLRILTNLFINEFRRDTRWGASVDIDTVTAMGDVAPVELQASARERPDNELLFGTLDEPMERALASLSAEMRACIVLVDIEQLEYSEASASLGIPIGTVRSRLSRARIILYDLLYDYARDLRRV